MEENRFALNRRCLLHIIFPLRPRSSVPRSWNLTAPTANPCGTPHKQTRRVAVSSLPRFYFTLSAVELRSRIISLDFASKEALGRRQIQNYKIYHLRYYPFLLDIFKIIHLKWISELILSREIYKMANI